MVMGARRLLRVFVAAGFLVALVCVAAGVFRGIVSAQANQVYSCGTYGADDYEFNDCSEVGDENNVGSGSIILSDVKQDKPQGIRSLISFVSNTPLLTLLTSSAIAFIGTFFIAAVIRHRRQQKKRE
jgi:hypothetical protein